MKICLLNNIYPPFDRGGGSEQVTANLAQGLQQAGHEIVIISTRPVNQPDPQIANHYYLASYFPLLHTLPKSLRLLWHLRDMFCIIKLLRVRKILLKEKCDLIISNNLMGLGHLVPRLATANQPWVHILHDAQLLHPSGLLYWGQEKIIDSLLAKLYQVWNSWCFKKVSLIISPSHWLLQLHQSKKLFGSAKQIQLFNPINLTEKSESRQPSATFNFLSVGQIVQHKGIAVLLRAWSELNQRLGDKQSRVKLIMIGTGPWLTSAQSLAKDQTNLEWLGKLPNAEVHNIMRQSHCLIVPSLTYENSPTVVFEAYNNNLPVIGSNLGGLQELLTESAGFTANDSTTLGSKMIAAMSHYADWQTELQAQKQKIKPLTPVEYLEIIMEEMK
ncbi:MAG: glycosyltransferase [bacterium]